mgnify:CR=1 FL=1
MEKEFVSYEQALVLKELGLKEDCLASYYHAGKRLGIGEYINHGNYTILAPLKQQVFRWFREKYNLLGITDLLDSRTASYLITNVIWRDIIEDMQSGFTSYEEAENACIDKLIELAKQQNEN